MHAQLFFRETLELRLELFLIEATRGSLAGDLAKERTDDRGKAAKKAGWS